MATIGLNIAGGEFGGAALYPTYDDLKFYADKGVDLIRVPFKWERVQDALGGPLDVSGDLARIKQILVDAAALGMDVILDCHNYGRFKGVALGAVGGPTAGQFADFWQKMAAELKDYPALAGYDLMNEPHDMPTSTIWKESAQAATNAIRQVDMDNTIIIEGTGWAGAHSWQKYNADLIISDPANNIVYQAHQYFDDNSSGTYDEPYEGEAADPMVGVRRLEPFVAWLKANNLKGMIGETGVPSDDPRWIEVMKNSLDYMMQNNLDVTAWGGGTRWKDGYSMYVGKPGAEDSAFGDLLERYYNKFDGFGTQGPAPTYTTPTVTIVNAVTVEGGTMTFKVIRSGDLSGTSVVNYATADGSAIKGSDYTTTTGTLTFAAGESAKTITVAVLSDSLVEVAETMKVNLTASSNVRIFDALGLGTISGEDQAPGTITGTDSTETINGTAANDTIHALNGDDTIYALDGNDTIIGGAGADYIHGGNGDDTVSYHTSGAGVNVDLTRAFQQGGDAEGDQLVSAGHLKGSGHDDTLAGNDSANTINGGGGRDVLIGRGGSDRFVFNTAAEANGDVIKDFAAGYDKLDLRSIDANVAVSGVQSFTWMDAGAFTGEAGQLREYDLNGKHFIAGDTNGDAVADFSIEVAGTLDLTTSDFLGTMSSAPAVAVNDVVVDETAGVLVFTITRSGDLSSASSVNYATANGTATAGSDYTAANGTVNFAAGQATTTVSIALINDTLVEGSETFTLTLAGGTNAILSDAQGVGTITSDDGGSTPPEGFPTSPTISGTDGNDRINAGASTIDYVDAKGGDDVITGVGGKDYIDGGAGNDTISYHWSGAHVDVDLLRADQRNGDASGDVLVNIENMRGSAHNDFLRGNEGANVIEGLGGQDVLTGRGGNDRFVFNTAAEADGDMVTDFAVGFDQLDLRSLDANVGLTGNQSFTWLNSGAFTGKAGQLREYDLDGKHFIAGDTNGDGLADFTIEVAGTSDLTTTDFVGTMGSEITGTNSGETITGTSGDDTIYALDGNDTIIGGGGADYIDGGNGSDTVSYRTSGAAVNVDLTRTIQQGGDAEGDQIVAAGYLTGSAYNDTLAGNDVGNFINGDGGSDILTSRGGNDRFVFDTALEASGDVITDFAVGYDKLDVRSIDANVAVSGDQLFTWLDSGAFTGTAGQLREYDLEGKHFVAGDTNGDGLADFAIEVAGTTDLTSTDFLL